MDLRDLVQSALAQSTKGMKSSRVDRVGSVHTWPDGVHLKLPDFGTTQWSGPPIGPDDVRWRIIRAAEKMWLDVTIGEVPPARTEPPYDIRYDLIEGRLTPYDTVADELVKDGYKIRWRVFGCLSEADATAFRLAKRSWIILTENGDFLPIGPTAPSAAVLRPVIERGMAAYYRAAPPPRPPIIRHPSTLPPIPYDPTPYWQYHQGDFIDAFRMHLLEEGYGGLHSFSDYNHNVSLLRLGKKSWFVIEEDGAVTWLAGSKRRRAFVNRAMVVTSRRYVK